MKRNNSSHSPLTIFRSTFLFGIIVLGGLWLLILKFNIFSSSETTISTVTPYPLPVSIQEVKSTCSKGQCIDACLAHVNNKILKEKILLPTYSSTDDIDLVYYGISKSDELEKPRFFNVPVDLLPYQQNIEIHTVIWNYFRNIIPVDQRPNLVTFGIYISSQSDGKFDTTATQNWIMKINLLAMDNAYELSSALIHEFGHYLTLNETQRATDKFCKREALYYCQAENSYLNLFYLQFWQDIYPEWKEIDTQSANYQEEKDSFYRKYQDRFINDYAATDPIEDIAESWSAFVLDPSHSDKSIADQKINFFNNFPDLVQLRYQIIQRICTFGKAQ